MTAKSIVSKAKNGAHICGPVYILLGAYNGAQYIAEQIYSIQRQTVENWRMLIRDDGSNDDTLDIIKKIANRDKRIRLIEDRKKNLGVVGNYGNLMTEARDDGADVVFFSDQDDLWLPDKLDVYLQRMQQLQMTFGEDVPLLVHSDLIVVNEKIDILGESFMAYQGIANENDNPLRTLLVQNFVTGCATAINGPLLNIALPFPKDILMHDWWVALCAAVFGMIGYIQSPTVLYRQHSANSVGAKYLLDVFNPFKTKPIERWKTSERHFLGSIQQANSLLTRIKKYPEKETEEASMLVQAYLNALSKSAIHRISRTHRLRCRRQGVLRQMLFLSRLAITGPHYS